MSRSKKLTQNADEGIILTPSRKLLLSLYRISIKEYPRENKTGRDSNKHFRLVSYVELHVEREKIMNLNYIS